MDLKLLSTLADPFPADDVEWRISRSGISNGKIYARVLAYITARAIQQRLDEVCGPANWKNEPPQIHEMRPGVKAVVTGISIRITHPAGDDEWITKWDVSEPTNIEPAKGGFSGAMKRAGAQWGIGRYLYHLEEAFAEISESGGPGWEYAKLSNDRGSFYWKAPKLPGWALPKGEDSLTDKELNALKQLWRTKMAAADLSVADLRDGFARFVRATCGDFPISDLTCWTREAHKKCVQALSQPVAVKGVSPDVPFGE